jgi:glycosyltransferase involved in cell wall biosynthesis
MKIVHFIAGIDKSGGGTTAYMKLLAEELTNFNIDQKIITGNSLDPVEIVGVEVVFFDLKGLSPFQIKRVKKVRNQFSSYLKVQRPDIVHINGIWLYQNYIFQKEAQKLGIKVILAPHGMMEPYIINRNPLKKKLALFLYQHKALQEVDYFHATAQSERSNIRALGYKKPSIIIANGIVIEDVIAKEVFNSGGFKELLFLSRVHPKKGIDLLIQAVSELNVKNLKITIAGDGDKKYINELISLAKNKGVDEIFHFVGPLYGAEKWNMFRSMDVFVLPTHSENFGIVVAESLLVGVPVITTQGTPWEELNRNRCGWWIDLSVENLKET